jgi:hypothetical protein
MKVAVAAIHRRQTMKPAAGYFSFQMKWIDTRHRSRQCNNNSLNQSRNETQSSS